MTSSRQTPTNTSRKVCANFRYVEFLNIHIPKAAGSSVECTLDDHREFWPLPLHLVHAARPAVAFYQISNHATFSDFMKGVPGAPYYGKPQVVRCPTLGRFSLRYSTHVLRHRSFSIVMVKCGLRAVLCAGEQRLRDFASEAAEVSGCPSQRSACARH
jgi:hypothetical protein